MTTCVQAYRWKAKLLRSQEDDGTARHLFKGYRRVHFRRYGYRDKETLIIIIIIIIITMISGETFGVPSSNDTPPLPNCS